MYFVYLKNYKLMQPLVYPAVIRIKRNHHLTWWFRRMPCVFYEAMPKSELNTPVSQ